MATSITTGASSIPLASATNNGQLSIADYNKLQHFQASVLSADGNATGVTVVDASGGNVNVTIPAPVDNGLTYKIIRSDTSANTVTLTPATGTINGAATAQLLNNASGAQAPEGNIIAFNGTDFFVAGSHNKTPNIVC